MIIFGKHPVQEFLENSPEAVKQVWVDQADRLPDVTAQVVSTFDLDELTDGGNHQGYALRSKGFQYAKLDDLIARDVVAILDQVQDPRNLGAIIRSAAAFNIPIIIPKDRSASVNATVVRTSAGLVFKIPVVQVTNISRTLERFKEEGYWSVGAEAHTDQAVADVPLDPKTVLVLGGESGMRRLTAEKCDFLAKIPMAPGVESLNVSVGFSIFAFEFRRRVGFPES